MLAGVDEVGRGPLAGPVVACAVIMPPNERAIPGVDDSKKLPPATRLKLALKIRERAVCVALGAASPAGAGQPELIGSCRRAQHRPGRSVDLAAGRSYRD